MRIGILTFHRALNYGAVLQCYALQQVLKEMGNDVEVIDYRPDYIEKYRDLWNRYLIKNAKGVCAKLKAVLSIVLRMSPKRRATKKFDGFIDRHLKVSAKVVVNVEDIPEDYDVYILGSDQIWNPVICNGYSPVFWGQFEHNNKSKLITYAVSLGLRSLPETDKERVKQYLSSFHAISVRENSLKIVLTELNSMNCSVVLDPTLLTESKLFDRIAIKPSLENYVLLITLEKDSHAMEFSLRIAQQLNCRVVRLSALSVSYWERLTHKTINRLGVSPEEYCGLFKYATCIVSISFHATAFSLMFKRNFYLLEKIGRAHV